eukprot:SAG31_NODE_39940_length_284_cov_0.875676_1_plen_33_part_10
MVYNLATKLFVTLDSGVDGLVRVRSELVSMAIS